MRRPSGSVYKRTHWTGSGFYSKDMQKTIDVVHNKSIRKSQHAMEHFFNSYMGTLRKAVGWKTKLINIGTRALICDPKEEAILLIRKRDSGDWAFPAGGLEIDETIMQCLRREVWEETGLNVISATPMAVYSDPQFETRGCRGEPYQSISFTFIVSRWSGELVIETRETTAAQFFSHAEIPILKERYREVLNDFEGYGGSFIVR